MSKVLSMSRPSTSRRCLQSMLQNRVERPSCSARAAIRRWYTATATVTSPPSPSLSTRLPTSREKSSSQSSPQLGTEEALHEDSSEGRDSASQVQHYTPEPRIPMDPKPLVNHLRKVFGKEFPPKLAKQMLTHVSAKESWECHNTRLSFLGRRALESYTLLFLHECITRPSSSTTKSLPLPSTPFDIDLLTYRALKTHILGEFVGTRWQLDKAMLWIPVRRKGKEEEKNIGGLYKVMGTTVEAIMGGIFHHYGGKYAHQIFHADVLPAILCPGSQYGLHDAFHARALEMEAIVRKEVGLEPSSSPSQRVPPSKLEQHSASTEPDQQERGKSL